MENTVKYYLTVKTALFHVTKVLKIYAKSLSYIKNIKYKTKVAI